MNPNRPSYRAALKAACIASVIAGASYARASTDHGPHAVSIKLWCEREGVRSRRALARRRRVYTMREKRLVTECVRHTRKVRATARLFDMPYNTVKLWLRTDAA